MSVMGSVADVSGDASEAESVAVLTNSSEDGSALQGAELSQALQQAPSQKMAGAPKVYTGAMAVCGMTPRYLYIIMSNVPRLPPRE